MVPFIGLIGKTEENRTCLGHKSFCRCSKVLGKCPNQPWKSRFLQAQIFWKYNVMPQSTLWATALLQIYRDCLLSVRLTSHSEFLRKLQNCNDKARVWERRINSSLVGELSRLHWPQRNIFSLHNLANLCCGGVCLLFPKAGVAKGQKFTNIAFSYIIIKRVPSLSSAEVNFSFHLCLHWIGMSGSWPWSKPQGDCSTEVV